MIKTLEIKNFKSIRHLKLDCKRINLFIGKPNTGKSNILESIGIFSLPHTSNLRDFVRFENMTNLFYDQDIDEKIKVTAIGTAGFRMGSERLPQFEYMVETAHYEIIFEKGIFIGEGGDEERKLFHFNFRFDYDGKGSTGISGYSPFKFYRFGVINIFPRQESDFFLPPKGENLLSILLTHKALKRVVSDIFSEYRLRIVLKPQERKIEAQKEIEDIIISYPYSLVSDTMQRVVFHLAAIETNKDSTIIFEEPEAHAFPFYTKFLAERITLDKGNQYFISTHNPYLLLSVLEKAPKDDIGVFIVYFKDYQTKVRPLMEEEMPEVLDLDASIFFNLDQFVGEE